MKVLGIGESVIDTAYIAGNEATTQHIGGPVPIAMMLLSRLGVECHFTTTLGEDNEGKLIEKELMRGNITLNIQREKQTKMNTYIINTTDGSRKKIRGAVVHNYIENLNTAYLQQFDLIIMDRHERVAFYEVLEKKRKTTKVLIDPSTEVSPFTLDMIRYADYPIVPIEVIHEISQTKQLSHCLKKLYALTNKPVIITAGALGSIIYDGVLPEVLPAITVNAVDVQGAGDVYRGAFAYGTLQGWDLGRTANYANLVAGLQCKKLGNASALPTKEEIEMYQMQLAEEKLEKIHQHLFEGGI